MYHFHPETPVSKPQECAAHGRNGNSWVSLLEFTLAYASLPSCPNTPGDLIVLVVTLDKLVRLRKRIRSSTIVSCSDCVCVYFPTCLLCVFLRMTDEGEFSTLPSFMCALFAEWCGDLSLYPTLTGPFSLGLGPESPQHAFVFIDNEVNSLILWPTTGFECCTQTSHDAGLCYWRYAFIPRFLTSKLILQLAFIATKYANHVTLVNFENPRVL